MNSFPEILFFIINLPGGYLSFLLSRYVFEFAYLPFIIASIVISTMVWVGVLYVIIRIVIRFGGTNVFAKKLQRYSKVIISGFTILLITYSSIFLWIFSQEYDGPDFSEPQGTFASAPVVTKEDDLYTITWETAKDYQHNELYMQKANDKHPYFTRNATTTYNETEKVYVHTATVRLNSNMRTNEGTIYIDASIVPVLEEGAYTYQVQSSGGTDLDPVISTVQSL